MARVTISILYTELADYSLACLKALKATGAKIQLVHWPINPEAPFQLDLSFIDEVIPRDTVDRDGLLTKVSAFQPDLILCSGWMDKDYVAVCRKLRGKAIAVLSLDNHWTGSAKQQVARLVAPFTIRRAFAKAFVPGEAQRQYALRLGFEESEIRTGFYSADTQKFNGFYDRLNLDKQKALPKRFLYLGRYVEHKGIFDLWSAFDKYRQAGGDWELWCVGTGEQYAQRVEGEGIRHFGFVQPSEMLPILQGCGVYILPSHFEPWGVSVHEMAVAGFPMLLSDAIGAREQFLIEGENGAVFPSGNADVLARKMQWITGLSNEELLQMSVRSHNLGMRHTPEIWADRLLSLL
ncbi:MAG: glycosyltransferase family 4 protein [Flavobacteriales bacterium]|nr:glycosyltransferase family 4 protein [Flavobacteriales bacterium]